MLIKEVISVLEEFAPPSLQESYDNSGWQCGNPEDKATGALICLDVTPQIIEEAIKKKCNLVIAHHPLIFSPIRKITGKDPTGQILIRAIKNNISIYACHTNADNVRAGVNHKMAQKLGLINTRVLQPKRDLLRKLVTFCPIAQAEQVRKALFAAGCGHIGNYDRCSFNTEGTGTFRGNDLTKPFTGKKNETHAEKETRIETIFEYHREKEILKALRSSHPNEEVAYDIYKLENEHSQVGSGLIGELNRPMEEKKFLEFTRKTFNAEGLKFTSLLGKDVKKVALCGGSGSFLLKDAIACQADVFLTADFKYHQFFEAENKLVIADIGHYETEQFTPELFLEVIHKKLPKFAVRLTDHNTNPINYL